MQIGFIGLGLMGRPMAQHLAAAGHQLHLWARREASLDPFRESGARFHPSPAAVARAADLVITIVADSPDVNALALGPDGLIEGAHPGLIVIDMSTIAPSMARHVAARLAEAGVAFLDAPVSGGEKGAKEASLTIMVGGDADAFDMVRPVLACLGRTITHIGPSGAGQVAKSCNQTIVAATMAGVAEALQLARKSGVDAATVREALLGGFAYSRILEHHGRRMLEGDFAPGFKAWMHQKDLRIVLNEAGQLNHPMPVTAGILQQLNALVGNGDGELDSIALYRLYNPQPSVD